MLHLRSNLRKITDKDLRPVKTDVISGPNPAHGLPSAKSRVQSRSNVRDVIIGTEKDLVMMGLVLQPCARRENKSRYNL